jgi:hypothetical protein
MGNDQIVILRDRNSIVKATVEFEGALAFAVLYEYGPAGGKKTLWKDRLALDVQFLKKLEPKQGDADYLYQKEIKLPEPNDKIRVQKERAFAPHHLLIQTAQIALEDAENKRPGYSRYELTCITFSALALEALGNSFGEKFIPRWKKDFESSSPIAKLRIICDHFQIAPDFNSEPWVSTIWLIKFRNCVAHAKPELVKEDGIFPHEEYHHNFYELPKSKLEKQVTLENAKRAVNCVNEILEILVSKIPAEVLGGLLVDGWTGQAGPPEGD